MPHCGSGTVSSSVCKTAVNVTGTAGCERSRFKRQAPYSDVYLESRSTAIVFNIKLLYTIPKCSSKTLIESSWHQQKCLHVSAQGSTGCCIRTMPWSTLPFIIMICRHTSSVRAMCVLTTSKHTANMMEAIRPPDIFGLDCSIPRSGIANNDSATCRHAATIYISRCFGICNNYNL